MLSIRHSWNLCAAKNREGNKYKRMVARTHEGELRETLIWTHTHTHTRTTRSHALTCLYTTFLVEFSCHYVTSILCLQQPSASLSCCLVRCAFPWGSELWGFIPDNEAQTLYDVIINTLVMLRMIRHFMQMWWTCACKQWQNTATLHFAITRSVRNRWFITPLEKYFLISLLKN